MRLPVLCVVGLLALACLAVSLSITAVREPESWPAGEADPCEELRRKVRGFSAELANETIPRTPEQRRALEARLREAKERLDTECR